MSNIKRRVEALETDGAGSYRERFIERMIEGQRHNEILWKKIRAMSEEELIKFAFDTNECASDRRQVLVKLVRDNLEKNRALNELIGLEKASIEVMKGRTDSLLGRARELNLRMIRANERMIRRYEDEKAPD